MDSRGPDCNEAPVKKEENGNLSTLCCEILYVQSGKEIQKTEDKESSPKLSCDSSDEVVSTPDLLSHHNVKRHASDCCLKCGMKIANLSR